MKAKVNGKILGDVTHGEGLWMKDGEHMDIDLLATQDGNFHALYGGRGYSAELVRMDAKDKKALVRVNNSLYTVELIDKTDELLMRMGIDTTAQRRTTDVKAPMPGMVVKVLVEQGTKVTVGDSLLILEAMKMENVIKAATDGVVKRVAVKQGQKVEKNELMINME